ncbi:MAG TPA: alkyl sulfatase dimerization domain-containing protein [Actinocrinis sp.]|jgi:alkyl sulfatase BDS1-like metallo-beta-lactamase superfamily hydrolase|uniref:alkyl/aryl-sulfatase n=1 Tax=Actinocrinis sp. TaxID=1920516 RepID=UPI002DDCA60F|nr:alkyl sulfatase dimerization domain-containing protein [Actinocrinis sp.]HEV3173634.1 alkyl sulfatase dimerization domain-containing protein [Actinocrinis sp.]
MAYARGPESKDATSLTTTMNAAVSVPPWATDPERQYAEDEDNCIYRLPITFTVVNADRVPVWSLVPYAFLMEAGDAPPEVNPSLWRNAKLNMNAGLYRVVENAVYQVRGMDLSNITFLEPADPKGSIVIVDPLVSEECAAAALKLYYSYRPYRPIGAVIYTHCHVDHYGGVGGVISQQDVDSKKVQVIAPAGFMDHAVSENVYAGVAMARRATFMYGVEILRGPKGQVDAGLGKATSWGTTGIIKPTFEISASTPPGQPVTICGIEFEFQLTPNTEAPAEMNFYLTQSRALCIAENATPTLHNIYSLRGAQVRDAKAWSEYLHDAVTGFGPRTDHLFASHFWPRWNTSSQPTAITDFLTSQADLYRFLHDQAMRDANEGRTMLEVAQDLDDQVPVSLSSQWFNHGYYGTANHNLKAVYQRYLGWYDGNAANLHALPPEEAGRRYVEALGGPEATFQMAVNLYNDPNVTVDDYRWCAQLLSHIVFGYPDRPAEAGRHQLADVLEQLGYQAESAPWRNFYLSAAAELREPRPPLRQAGVITLDMMNAMTVRQVFDYLALRAGLARPQHPVDAPTIGLTVLNPDGTDLETTVRYRNSVLVYEEAAPPGGTADATYLITRAGLSSLALGTSPADLPAGALKVMTGSMLPINAIYDSLVDFDINFPLTRP